MLYEHTRGWLRTVKNSEVDELEIRVGEVYRIEPPNPQCLRHRGRLCRVVGYQDLGIAPKVGRNAAKVRFLDNKRPGLIDLTDLVRVA